VLYRSLQLAERMIADGERNAERIATAMRGLIQAVKSAKIDYVAIVDPVTLEPVAEIRGEVLIPLAVRIGKTRLIDNVVVKTEGNFGKSLRDCSRMASRRCEKNP